MGFPVPALLQEGDPELPLDLGIVGGEVQGRREGRHGRARSAPALLHHPQEFKGLGIARGQFRGPGQVAGRFVQVAAGGQQEAQGHPGGRVVRFQTLAGAVAAPLLLLWGLKATPGSTASLLLSFEVVFTALWAAGLFKEHVAGLVWWAVLAMTAGGLVLGLEGSGDWGVSLGRSQWWVGVPSGASTTT